MKHLKNILIGVDFLPEEALLTEGSSIAAQQAFWLARGTGAKIRFLHSTFELETTPADQPARAAKVKSIKEFCAKHAADVECVPLEFTPERAWMALSRESIAGRADLLVVAKRNSTRRDDRKLGSVSLELIRNCPAPVWVVKPEQALIHGCVLAATDLSPVGNLATRYAAYIAEASHCPLCVVHAWQMPMELQLSSARIGHAETQERRNAIALNAKKKIESLPEVRALGQQAKIFTTCDSPSRAILQIVEDRQPDLVVMGTLSRSGVPGLLVGNTAEKLLYRLDCSLLTVKPHDFQSPVLPDDLHSKAKPAESTEASGKVSITS